MALPGYLRILQGYYNGNFISFTQKKSFGDILKKKNMSNAAV